MEGIVYKMHWPETGHYYIGLTTNLKQRKLTHLCSMSYGSHCNKYVQILFVVYGFPKFSIIKKGCYFELKDLETKLIKRYSLDEMFVSYPSISGDRISFFNKKMDNFISSIS